MRAERLQSGQEYLRQYGAVAVLMMPRTNPTRRLAAKAANKVEDVAWKVSDTISSKMDDMDL